MSLSRIHRPILLVVAAVIMLGMIGCKPEAKSPKLGLDSKGSVKGVSAEKTSDATGTSDATTAPRATSPGKTGTSTGASQGGGTQSSTNGSGSKPGKTSGGTTSGETAKKANVRILWWNDTKTKKPTGWTITLAGSSLKPDVSQKSGTGLLGPAPVGGALELVVYPDGPKGTMVVIPVALTADMEAGSERDAIHVEVSDKSVRVLGNPVDNFDRSVDRF